MKEIGKWMVLAGLVLCCMGLLVWKWPGALRWAGHLPGDIRVERPGIKVYIPLTTMILASLVLSAVLWLLQKWNR